MDQNTLFVDFVLLSDANYANIASWGKLIKQGISLAFR